MAKVTVKRVDYYKVTYKLGPVGSGVDNVTVEDMADCLRYDSAFISETCPGVVAIPSFHHRTKGRWGGVPRAERWWSFGLRLVQLDRSNPVYPTDHWNHEWYTYRNVRPGSTGLVRTTFAEYVSQKEKE